MFLDELTKLATQTSLIVVALLVIGVIFCFIEAMLPGFGFFGITGILCVIAGIVVHAVLSGSALQVLFILIILALVFSLIVLLFVRSAKYGLLAKLSFVENKTALPLDYGQNDDKNLISLIGKTGKTITECRPIGKIQIEGEVYDASTKGELLQKDIEILITEVEGNAIYIEKLFKNRKGEK